MTADARYPVNDVNNPQPYRDFQTVAARLDISGIDAHSRAVRIAEETPGAVVDLGATYLRALAELANERQRAIA